MVTFIIFWAAVFALLFFVLAVIFKILASALEALLSAGGQTLAVGFLAIIIVIALSLFYAIVDGIIKEGLLSVLGTIVLFVIVLGILGAIFGGLGAALIELVVAAALFVLEIVSGVLEWLADKCEDGYIKFLRIIVNRIDNC
ncbi:MAG: hypothetical protein NC094_04265 [Bacteroidales bacterium]|nr:hypothetical protein [Lachnoclostridium sp.]MCM1383162.1 hypothetical protein [Lachnoclostridium sp.]MCM1464612.1 hypothetical protein [Bacteroidales bacterium]